MNYFKNAYNWLISVNFVHILTLGLLVKSLISDVSYPTFLLIIPVLGFEAYKLFVKSKTPDPIQLDAELRKELDNIKSKVNAQTLEAGVKQMPTKRYF